MPRVRSPTKELGLMNPAAMNGISTEEENIMIGDRSHSEPSLKGSYTPKAAQKRKMGQIPTIK